MNRIKSLLFVLFVVFDHFIISFFFFNLCQSFTLVLLALTLSSEMNYFSLTICIFVTRSLVMLLRFIVTGFLIGLLYLQGKK